MGIAEILPPITHHSEITTKEVGQIFVGGRKILLQATVQKDEPAAEKPEETDKPETKQKTDTTKKPAKQPEEKPKPEIVEEEDIVIDENLPAWKKNILKKKQEKIEERRKS